MAITGSFQNGTITLFGDALNNTITESRDVAGTILANGGAVAIAGVTPTIANTSLTQIFGQDGNDTLALDESNGALPAANLFGGPSNDVIVGGSGDDELFGQAGNDTLLGKGGNDLLFGGDGNDTLTGGTGDDQMFGESGDDRMIWNPGEGTDLMEGGDGTDTAEVNGGNGAEVFTITPNGTRVRFDRASPAPFSLDIGTAEKLVLNANGGDDVIIAAGNLAALIQFTIDGGSGNDTITGSNGADTLLGGDGNDIITGAQGDDTASLGDGDDTYIWNPGDASDTVDGGAGTDTLVFNGANVSENIDISANGGHVHFSRNVANVVMDLNSVENIQFKALGGADRIVVNDLAGTGVRQIDLDLAAGGSTAPDQTFDLTVVNAGDGNNNIRVVANGTGLGVDVLGLSEDIHVTHMDLFDALIVNGGGGDDTIAAGGNLAAILDLTIDGGAGNDTITGGNGADTLRGGDGNDTIVGGQGNDTVDLGAGDDTFIWSPGDGSDQITGGAGFDRVVFNGANVGEKFTISNDDGFGSIQRDVAAITLLTDGVERLEIHALGGVDSFTITDMAGSGVAQIAIDLAAQLGGSEPDTSADLVTLNGANGADSFTLSSAGSMLIVNGLSTQVTIDHAGAGDLLLIQSLGGDDVIDASAVTTATIAMTIDAGTGNDTIIGGSGADILLGGDGNDTLTGGKGNDVALLGAGDDTFIWNAGDGSDTIEGQDGSNQLLAIGSSAADNFTLAANGQRVVLLHDAGAGTSTLDINDTQHVGIATGGGADTVSIGDLDLTDAKDVAVNLGKTGLNVSDGVLDTVNIFATNAVDQISVLSSGNAIVAKRGDASVTITNADSFDQVHLLGGIGNDIIDASQVRAGAASLVVEGGVGADLLIGGGGNDTASYASSAAGVNVNLLTGKVSGGDAQGDHLQSIESVIGSARNDQLIGDNGANVLTGGAGDDIIVGGTGDDTAVFNVDFDTVTVSFAGDKVIIDSAEGHDVLTGIEHFRFTDGAIDRADGNPLVDDLFYYANNKDVWDAGADADVHYNTFGWHEGRDPNAEFSTNGYLSANADVRAAGVNPLWHFDTIGWKEGRDPSVTFDTELYLAQNPDVAASGVDPLAQFEQSGRDEGRHLSPAVGHVNAFGFDAEFYLLQNPDVGFAGVDPFTHFEQFGAKEGRNPNAFFDTKGYLAAYADVAAAGVNPLDHYLQHGAPEGRDPSGAFDTLAYLKANPDVAAAGVNPLEHFLQFGIHEGRQALGDGLFH